MKFCARCGTPDSFTLFNLPPGSALRELAFEAGTSSILPPCDKARRGSPLQQHGFAAAEMPAFALVPRTQLFGNRHHCVYGGAEQESVERSRTHHQLSRIIREQRLFLKFRLQPLQAFSVRGSGQVNNSALKCVNQIVLREFPHLTKICRHER